MLNKGSAFLVALFGICATCSCADAAPNSSISKEDTDSREISSVDDRVKVLESENRKLWVQRNIQRRQIKDISARLAIIEEYAKDFPADEKRMQELEKGVGELATFVETNKENGKRIKEISDSFDRKNQDLGVSVSINQSQIALLKGEVAELASSSGELKANNATLEKIGIEFIVGVAIFLLLVGVAFVTLKKKLAGVESLVREYKAKSEEWNAKTLDQLKQEATKLSEFSEALARADVVEANKQTDHSLVKALVDRITFMQMTLSKMEPTVRGYRQLSKSVRQMLDTLLVNGYEVVDMLGQPYHEGIKAIVNFVDDEDLKEGEQIITAILKPQINYKGTVIQTAQITVSQNI